MSIKPTSARVAPPVAIILFATIFFTGGSALAADKPGFIVEPFWLSKTMDRESLFFLRSTPADLPKASLLFTPEKLISIKSASGETAYENEKDFTWHAGTRTITLTKDSRIPFKDIAAMYPPKGSPNSIDGCKGKDCNLFFDNGHGFHDLQVEATYSHAGNEWKTPAPEFAGAKLPRTLAKLTAKEPASLVLLGDSISEGYNASKFSNAPPHQPAYGELVGINLAHHFGGEVTFKNHSVGGRDAAWGVTVIDQVIADKPDLVILAFGMNDASGRQTPEAFAGNIRKQVEGIRKAKPDAEFILVASMTGNSDWTHSSPDLYPAYRDALAKLSGDGVVLADLTTVWTALLEKKSFSDLTGNGVNHPNDFGHRIYAEIILAALIKDFGK